MVIARTTDFDETFENFREHKWEEILDETLGIWKKWQKSAKKQIATPVEVHSRKLGAIESDY